MPESGPCAPCFSREKVEDGTAPAVVKPRTLDDASAPKAAQNGETDAKAPADAEPEPGADGTASASAHFQRIVSLLRGNTSALEEPLIKKKEEKPPDIICAAWVIEDALDGHCADEYPEGEEAKELRSRANRLFNLKKITFYLSVFLVLMEFMEVPLWCSPVESAQDTTWSAKDYCPIKEVKEDDYKDVLFIQTVIPPKYGMLVEAVCYSVLTLVFLYEFCLSRALGETRRLANCMPGRFLAILGLMWLDLGYYYFRWDQGFFSSFRFAPYGRVMLLFSGARVRWVFSSCWNCLDEFGSVCIFLMGCVVLFAWMLYNIFDDLADMEIKKNPKSLATPASMAGDDDGVFFATFGMTFVTFFTIMTGAAFPDNVTAVLKQSHWYALVFYPFMGLSFFLFTQLMLAVVYNAYSGETEDRLKDFYIQRSKGLAKTFGLLSVENEQGEKIIKIDTFSSLVDVLSCWPRFKGRLRKQDSEVLFEALDDDSTGTLSMNEFFDACSILQYTIWSTSMQSIFLRKCKFPGLGLVEKFVASGWLQHWTEAVLIANAIFIVIQSYYDFANYDEPKFFPYIEFFFSVIYMVEVVMKLLVESFQYYWSKMSNRFDFFVSWVLFLGGSLVFYDEQMDTSTGWHLDEVMQYFNILRVLRLLRLFTQVPRLKKMCICIGKFCQVSGDMVILFFISTTLLAIVGVQVFGGLLYPGSTDSEGDFAGAGFDVLGFNDLTGAFLALMDMMVTAYSPEYAQAMDEVLPIETPFLKIECIGEIYCMVVFFLSVNIAFNIFTAFLIDIFVSLEEALEEGEESEEDKNLASMKQKFLEKGEVLHFLEPPEVLRLRTLTGVIDGLDDAIQEAQDEALGKSPDDDDDKGGAEAEAEGDLQGLATETLGSFREAEYITKLVGKLNKESIMKPSDMLVVSKEAMEEKFSSHGDFQFVELADSIRIREAAEAKTATP
mmetsp:Transcript_99541/g.172793  ORF Transcript_99541/g.172793 Transcript_99541/m.172793 type:complete len:948 (+) Transcript_99541:27-2870(+)